MPEVIIIILVLLILILFIIAEVIFYIGGNL